MPNGTVVPFDLIASYKDTQNESQNVFSNGYGTTKLDSTILMCTGDEPAAGGVSSGTIRGMVNMLPSSCTVRANGMPVMRKNDVVTMNNGNTLGIIEVLQPIGDLAGMVSENVDTNKDKIKKYQDLKKKIETRKFKIKERKIQSNKTLTDRMKKLEGKMKNPLPGIKNLPIATGALKRVPVAMQAYSTYKAADALAKGDDKEALKVSSSALVGTAVGGGGLAACAWLLPAGGWPGLACGVVVIGASFFASFKTEQFIEENVPDNPAK
jgi:hypothetical protein